MKKNDPNCGAIPDNDQDGWYDYEDCDDNDANSTNIYEDMDCDGVITAEDCNDSDSSITNSNVNDADCDGTLTTEDCNDNDPASGSMIDDADCEGVSRAHDHCGPNRRLACKQLFSEAVWMRRKTN